MMLKYWETLREAVRPEFFSPPCREGQLLHKIVQILSLSYPFGVSTPPHLSRSGYTPDLDLDPAPDYLLLQPFHPLKGLRSFPNGLCSFPLNGILFSFLIMMLTNEFCPRMLSHPCFRWLGSLHFLPWSTTSL